MSLLRAHMHLARSFLRMRGLRTEWIHTPYGRVHTYRGHGSTDGLPIVVLHGLGSYATAYAPLLSRLRPHASQILAPDLPGHGFSDLPPGGLEPAKLQETVNGVLRALSHEPFVLMGTSLGGGLALRFSLEHPELVKKLILVSPAGAPMSDESSAQLFKRFEMNSVSDGIDYVRRIFDRPPWYTPILGREVYKVLKNPMVTRLVSDASPDDFLTVEEAGQLTAPTLLIWGRSERLLPADCLAWYREHLPAATRIEEPEGYGHTPHLEHPADLVKRVIQFSNT